MMTPRLNPRSEVMARAQTGKSAKGKTVAKKAKKPVVARKAVKTKAKAAPSPKKAAAKAVKPATKRPQSASARTVKKPPTGMALKTVAKKPTKQAAPKAVPKEPVARPGQKTAGPAPAPGKAAKVPVAKKPATKKAAAKAAPASAVPRAPAAPVEPYKSAYQIAEERRAAKERREFDREQAAANFRALVEANKQHARQGPTWPVSSYHAGRLASVGSGHEFHPHEAPAGASGGSKRIQQPRRGKR
jgi:hypothetical protein